VCYDNDKKTLNERDISLTRSSSAADVDNASVVVGLDAGAVQQSASTGGDVQRRDAGEHLAADETDAVLVAVPVRARDELTLNFAVTEGRAQRRRRRRLFVGHLPFRQHGDDGVRAVVLQTRQVVGRVEQVQAVDFDARAHLVAPVSSAQPQSWPVLPAHQWRHTHASVTVGGQSS